MRRARVRAEKEIFETVTRKHRDPLKATTANHVLQPRSTYPIKTKVGAPVGERHRSIFDASLPHLPHTYIAATEVSVVNPDHLCNWDCVIAHKIRTMRIVLLTE